jgi:hypothetical protein
MVGIKSLFVAIALVVVALLWQGSKQNLPVTEKVEGSYDYIIGMYLYLCL